MQRVLDAKDRELLAERKSKRLELAKIANALDEKDHAIAVLNASDREFHELLEARNKSEADLRSENEKLERDTEKLKRDIEKLRMAWSDRIGNSVPYR